MASKSSWANQYQATKQNSTDIRCCFSIYGMISFKHYLMVEEDVSVLNQYLKQRGLTMPQLIQQLQAGKPSGQGGNSDFYTIPDTNYGLRVKRRGFKADQGDPQLAAVHNPFGDENHGQAVANFGNNVEVLKLQGGKPAGIKYRRGSFENTPEDVEEYKQQVLHAAAMPQEEYNRLLKSIVDLNNKGYQVDPSKPGNLLIDPNTGRFNLVDLNKTEKGSTYRNTAGEIMTMLIANNPFSQHLYKDEEMKRAAMQIIKKMEVASQVSGLEMNDYSSTKFSYSLAKGEYEPYVPPPPDPNPAPKLPWGRLEF